MLNLLKFEDFCLKNGGVAYFAIVNINRYFDEVARFVPGLDVEALKCYQSLDKEKGYRLGAQCKNENFIYYEG